MWVDGKQFADAPESNATGMVPVIVVGLKVTLFVGLLLGFTRSAFAVFKIEVGVAVDMVDRVDADDPAVVTVGWCCCDSDRFKQKSEDGARLQLCVFVLLSWLKRCFLRSWRRAPAPLVVASSDVKF